MIRYIQLTTLFFVILCLFIISSCEKKSTPSELTQGAVDSLHLALQTMDDSLEISWQRMMEDDDQKIADARRLLEEISYTNQYNPVQFDSLQQNLKTLTVMRY